MGIIEARGKVEMMYSGYLLPTCCHYKLKKKDT